ncbi:RNA binding protein [Coprinopsis sp. MPI-PUGE-AT-0042]|nr:RNA binding protein [Coprinopsis sp. MPI-PUGE-AT-0042]
MTAGNTAQKLTKKQKKALAFRDRGKKKTSSTTAAKDVSAAHRTSDADDDGDDLMEVEDNAIPVMEDQDIADLQSSSVEVEGGDKVGKKGGRDSGQKGGEAGTGKGKGKAKVRADKGELGDAAGAGKNKCKDISKKRKRDDEDEDVQDEQDVKKQPKTKKAKEGEEEEDRKAQRFILFVGNLKYTTTKDQILSHFSKVCNPPPTVRLLTPKPKPGVAARPKSKGCAFLEFPTKAPLQEALKLHQSMLDDRMINVELTAGGGGKSEARLSKLRERNKALIGQRIKKVEKGDKSAILSRPDKPQRYSATSGLDQTEAQMTKRTWSVGDVVEETHRGGKRHQKRGARKPGKSHGTGVNAIPVG